MLTATNDGSQAEILEIGPYYIPSSGNEQPYIVPQQGSVEIPPGGTIQVPINGYCADIRRPPVGDGQPMPPFESWIKPGPLPDKWRPAPSAGWEPIDPAGNVPEILIPGTDTPLGHTIDQDKYPVEVAPVLLEAINLITGAYDHLKDEGVIVTPFSNDRNREREAVIQQTFWMFTSALGGEEYDKEMFTEQLIEQYESTTGQDYDKAPVPVQQQLTGGVDDFWNTFQLVGVEAKILPSVSTGHTPETPRTTTSPVTTVKADACGPDLHTKCTPEACYAFKIEVADSWGNQSERDSIRAQLTRNLAKMGVGEKGEEEDEEDGDAKYGIGKMPAAAYAFWKMNHIGGQSAAYAKTLFFKDRGTEWVGNTDPVNARVSGSKETTLRFDGDNNCTSFVVGVALARVKAGSFAFDAAAGNTEHGLTVLKLLYELGDIAIDLALTKGKITGKKLVEKLKDYVKEKFKDELKDLAKEAAEELLGEKVRELAKEYGIDLEGVDLDDIPDAEISMEKIVPAGAKTKAEAEGELTITVGGKSGTAKAFSGAYYNRKGLEDKSKTLTGTGSACHEVIVSDSRPGSLTSKVSGISHTRGEAEGNGYADAALESMYATVMIGVCECPGGTWSWESYSDAGFYAKDGTRMGLVNLDFEDMIEEVGNTLGEAKNRNAASLQKSLEEAMKKWAAEHPLIFKDCTTK